jgi:hypothetical protein
MTCSRAMDIFLDEDGGNATSFIDYIGARLHLLRCRRCRHELAQVEEALDLMRTDFLPNAPDLSDAVMAAIQQDVAAAAAKAVDESAEEIMSLRTWVFAGVTIFASLAISPLGAAFNRLVRSLGSDLILPIALTLGAVLTAYCALFIASHLEELAERFGLTRQA